MKHASQIKLEKIQLSGYSTCDCCSGYGEGLQIRKSAFSSLRLCKKCVDELKLFVDPVTKEA